MEDVTWGFICFGLTALDAVFKTLFLGLYSSKEDVLYEVCNNLGLVYEQSPIGPQFEHPQSFQGRAGFGPINLKTISRPKGLFNVRTAQTISSVFCETVFST